jgi:Flp pilus assembly protein TadG
MNRRRVQVHLHFRRDRGYVTALFALCLMLLCVFVGFTVDVGGWYARAAQIQRGADAAALAGVVWMPDYGEAQKYALEAAARNGFVDGAGNITVKVDKIPDNNRQLKVTITDGKASQFFSQLVRKGQTLTRAATAEYVLPVPLGSPKNTFGTGDLLSGSDRENFWAAVNGYCAGHESGDKLLARYESYSTSSTNSACNNGSDQADDYDPNGYLYAIELGANATSLKLDVYDASFNRSGSAADMSLGGNSQTITTIFQIYDRNPTPLDLSNLTLIKTVTVSTNDSSYQNTWKNFYTWTAPKAGTYYVRVKTAVEATGSRGTNGFALRAYTGNSFSTCTTIVGQTGYSATCPQIHAVSDMSIFANLDGTTADFYLAQVDPVHAGKTMRVTLFDAGEGASSIQILDPNGNPATFSWTTACNPPTPPSGGCSASSVSSLNVAGTGTQPYSNLQSNSKYNDRYMTLDIQLPNNYATAYGGKTWWKVRYAVGNSATDRTTWSANIIGDPVHLIG